MQSWKNKKNWIREKNWNYSGNVDCFKLGFELEREINWLNLVLNWERGNGLGAT